MDKPITIIVDETEKSLINTINDSRLPAFIIEPILEKILGEIKIAKQNQLQVDLEKYQKSLDKDNKDSDKDVR